MPDTLVQLSSVNFARGEELSRTGSVGMPERPPGRVHLIAETPEQNRQQVFASQPCSQA